jgi:hypothetical protein
MRTSNGCEQGVSRPGSTQISEEDRALRIDPLGAEKAKTSLESRYRPIYLNLFSLLRKQMEHSRIRDVGATVTKSAAWNRHAALKHYVDADSDRSEGFYLGGWQPDVFRDSLNRRKGLIVSSDRAKPADYSCSRALSPSRRVSARR